MKARIPADMKASLGEHVGLSFRPEKLSVFDKSTGRVLKSALHEGGVHG